MLAAVIVTASLPPFARAGATLDVTVSAVGDATSLLGGTLVMTPLNGADGTIYAVAQGSILAGGGRCRRRRRTRNPWRANGWHQFPAAARVEREVDFALGPA